MNLEKNLIIIFYKECDKSEKYSTVEYCSKIYLDYIAYIVYTFNNTDYIFVHSAIMTRHISQTLRCLHLNNIAAILVINISSILPTFSV